MKKLSILLFATVVAVNVQGQKLPAVQKNALRAPSNIKVDGKATDWGDKFEAANPTTELLYTIANDDKKLYLVVQTDVPDVYNRISNGGIKLIVQKNGRKTEEGAAVVKFPYREKPGDLIFNPGVFSIMVDQGSVKFNNTPEKKPESQAKADSIMQVNNKKLTSSLKWIYTSGIAGIDSLVSVYNDSGIEAAVAFDDKRVYTCEIAIDLKLLGLNAATADKFSYHVVVNGAPNKYTGLTFSSGGAAGVSTIPVISAPAAVTDNPAAAERLRAANEAIQAAYLPRFATTDFWGEYTLSK